jgi:CHAT domain-containing protein/tetratricopeptide (TPR) repeat protein
VRLAVDPPKSGADRSEKNLWTEIADLASARARAEFIDRHAELVQPAVVSSLTALVPQLVKSDRNKALAVAEAAVMIANRLGEAESVAQSLRAKANAHYALGQNKTALEHHRKALRLFRSLGHKEQVARTLSSSIQPLILQGRYVQAFAAAREARKIFTEQGNRWRVARLDLNLGNILDRQDRFAEALECYERAYQYLSRLEQDDPEGVAVALHNMAVSYVSLNDFRAAENTYERARSFAAAHDMPVLVGQADYNIAWLHYLRGDYSRAISMLRAARETCRSTGDEYHVALCHLDLSEIYLELNLIAEAAEAAEQAGASFSQLEMQYERAKSIANQAVAMSQQGNAARSLELFLQARQIFAKEKNKVLPSVIDQYRALVLFGENRDAEARRLCLAALHVLQRFKLTNKAIVCRLLLARLYLRQNDVRSALQQCARALKSLASVELPVLSCQAYALRGQIHAAAGHDRRSYDAYRRAKGYLDSLRNRIHTEELKISFMKDRVEIYEALVALCMKRPESATVMSEIFGYVEQAKSRTLSDFLSTSRSPWLGSQSQPEHAKRIRELREELNWYFHRIEMAQLKQASRHELTALRTESHRRERELLKLSREHVPANDQEPARQLTASYTIHQVRESLPAGATILEYFQAQGRIVVLLLSHDRFQIVPLGELSRISTVLDLLHLQMSKLRLDPGYVKSFASALLHATQTHLQELYKLLVEPIRESLAAGHLVIAPHGILHDLPFQALFNGRQYLIEEFTVSYAPSASVYAGCQARSAHVNGGSVVRGSLVLGIPDSSVPFVQEEVEAVAACLPNSEVLLGPDATAERLRQKGPRSRFIHIATHGYFRRDNPMFSGIRLGDSYLSLYDLYQLKLPVELVTLSGCSTGLNVVAAGDELLGLARGLLLAGAETSMLTQWDVQDQSSAQLMKFFYGNLAGGSSKAVALQEAMRQVKSERPHPYYWAPFILVGKA